MAGKAKKRSGVMAPPKPTGEETRIEDVTVERLVFESVKSGLSTGVADVLEDGVLEETMQGATGLKLDLLDRDYEALKSGLFGQRVICTLDGCTFRLTKLSLVDDWKLSALFEHRLVSEMREHTGPLKAQRGKVTRAEFILEMLHELKLPFRFICPELHRVQKAEKAKAPKTKKKAGESESQTATASLASAGKGPGLATSGGYTVKGNAATAAQLQVVAQGLEAAQHVGANALSMTALAVALIFENECSNPDPGDPGDRGCLSLIDSTIHSIQKKTGEGTINPYDISEVCEHFCTAGYTGKGGSNSLARANPGDSPTHIAYQVQGPAKEYPHTSEAEARKMVEGFLGGGISFTGGGSTESQTATQVQTATYEFTRGKPGQYEDTFTCALRLASEVGWHFFVSGKNDIYFVNDDDLLKAVPRYTIRHDDEGFMKMTFDVEVGLRTVIVHGKRQPKPSEAILIVRADRWGAPPGCVIELDGWGPADHPWLVDSVERHLHDAETTIHLRAPQHPLEEPKPTLTPVEGSGSETPSGGVTGFPPDGGGQYRTAPSQGPIGTGTFQGIQVALWTIPMLEYAVAHGWKGHITSGYRPGPDPHTSSGGSEHAGTQYPHGAIDFAGYGPPSPNRESFFTACIGFTGLTLIPAQFPGDGGHSSGTGH